MLSELKEGVEGFMAKYNEKFSQVEKALQRSERLALGGGSYSDPKNAEYSKAFNAFMRHGDESALRSIRAAVETIDDGKGGYGVPRNSTNRSGRSCRTSTRCGRCAT